MIPALKIKLPTLADEIEARLPDLIRENPGGVTLKSLTSTIGAEIAHIRRAATELNASARAWLMRRRSSRELFLAPNNTKLDGLRICASCGQPFEPPFYVSPEGRKKVYPRRCCTRACGIAWSWTRPGVREKRKAGILVERQTPAAKARTAAHNRKRWSRPGEREKMAEQNRRQWADPVKRAIRSQAIKAEHSRPEKRKFYSDLRKKWWQDPEMRKKMHDAASASQKTQAYRQKLSTLTKERWADPVWRAKWERANREKVKQIAERNRGRRQSAQQIAKRVVATRRTKEAKKAVAATVS